MRFTRRTLIRKQRHVAVMTRLNFIDQMLREVIRMLKEVPK